MGEVVGVQIDPTPGGGCTWPPIPVWQVSRHVLRIIKTCRVLDALSFEHIFPQRGNTPDMRGFELPRNPRQFADSAM